MIFREYVNGSMNINDCKEECKNKIECAHETPINETFSEAELQKRLAIQNKKLQNSQKKNDVSNIAFWKHAIETTKNDLKKYSGAEKTYKRPDGYFGGHPEAEKLADGKTHSEIQSELRQLNMDMTKLANAMKPIPNSMVAKRDALQKIETKMRMNKN